MQSSQSFLGLAPLTWTGDRESSYLGGEECVAARGVLGPLRFLLILKPSLAQEGPTGLVMSANSYFSMKKEVLPHKNKGVP